MDSLERMTDADLLALLIAAESDGEPLAGQVAVACVVIERLRRRRWGDTLRAVMLAPAQFSTFNDTGKPGPADDHWQRFRHRFPLYWMMARLAMDGLLNSPVNGATHYCRHDLEPKPRYTLPKYSIYRGRIGAHVFYQEL